MKIITRIASANMDVFLILKEMLMPVHCSHA